MKKILLAATLAVCSMTAGASDVIGAKSILDSGILALGTMIGDCEVVLSRPIHVGRSMIVDGMAIEVRQGTKLVQGVFSNVLSVFEIKEIESEVIESEINSTTGSTTFFTGGKQKKTFQYVQVVAKEISPGEKMVTNLIIEAKEEGIFGKMKVVKDRSINCTI